MAPNVDPPAANRNTWMPLQWNAIAQLRMPDPRGDPVRQRRALRPGPAPATLQARYGPARDADTLTLLTSEAELLAGAYSCEPHKSAITLRNGATARASFTRMAVLSAEGRWNGRDTPDYIARPM
jgi:hypothetical protein